MGRWWTRVVVSDDVLTIWILGSVSCGGQMLLLLKSQDCLRHIDRELGSPVNSSLIIAGECSKALLREELKSKPRDDLGPLSCTDDAELTHKSLLYVVIVAVHQVQV